MKHNNKTVRFDDQDFYVGVDVHHKSWKVTIRTAATEVRTMSMPPEPSGLVRYLERHFPGGRYHSAYEAGFSGFWAHRQLEELGVHNRVVHAADVPTSDKERRQKDDVRDSRKLACQLEKGDLKAIYVPDPELAQLRSLCRLRERSRAQTHRLKNRIKGFLKYYGIQMEEDSAYRHWSGVFISRLEALCVEPGPGSDALAITIDALKEESKRLATITRKLRKHCKEGPGAEVVSLLRSIPGIGPITAMTLYTEIQDIERFPDLDRFNSFLGLIPSTASSGDQDRSYGITPRCNKKMRALLIEAAWVSIRYDEELLQDFSRLSNRMKKQAAIVRIARKLAARIARVWRTEEPYKKVIPT